MEDPDLQDIARPHVLDPERPRLRGDLRVEDEAAQAEDLQRALDAACDYGRSLWEQLAATRRYLAASLPDPMVPDEQGEALTAPRGPGDEEGWRAWRTAYAGTTAVLAGPAADSGFGALEARQLETARRGTQASSRWADMERLTEQRRRQAREELAAWGDPDVEDRLAEVDPAFPELAPGARRSASGPHEEPERPTASARGAAGTGRQLAVVTGAVGVLLGWVLGRRQSRHAVDAR